MGITAPVLRTGSSTNVHLIAKKRTCAPQGFMTSALHAILMPTLNP